LQPNNIAVSTTRNLQASNDNSNSVVVLEVMQNSEGWWMKMLNWIRIKSKTIYFRQ